MYWKSALSIPYSPLMDCYFYTSANGEWQVAVYTLLFFFIVSINGLLLLHIYKRRMGCEPYMPYGFPSLSPLTDCYLYTSANEEWACNLVEVPGIKNRGIKKCKAKDNQIIIHFSSVPLF